MLAFSCRRTSVTTATAAVAMAMLTGVTPAQAASGAPAAVPALTAPTTVSRPGDAAGALPFGTARYAVPAGAVIVAPYGSDTNAGTVAAPLKTIAKALTTVAPGGTVVVRAGVYNESLAVYKSITVQNYPGETVWVDGSTRVNGWVKDGDLWRADNWKARFDASPTYTKGAPDSTAPGWQFVNPATPMAAHPDQVWLAGYQQWQVGSLAEVKPGMFYVDEATSKLYLGSDPTGKSVFASNLSRAMAVRAPDVTIQGIGFRRFANSVWQMGAVTLEAPRAKVENVWISDMATTGISMMAADQSLNKVTVQWCGLMGIHARFADRMSLTSVLATKNNSQYFNAAPNAGGVKIGATRGVSVSDSSFSGNFAYGFWEDLSVYDSVIKRSTFADNTEDGLFLEISAKAVVGDNFFARNKGNGLKVNNTSDVKVWNNTFIGNSRPLNLVQDPRRNTNKYDQAVDPRQPFPDPTMPWTLGPVQVSNNIFGPTSAGNCVLCVEDYGFTMSAEKMGIKADGNLYNRVSATSPTWLNVWSSGSKNPYVFNTLAAFRTKTGQEVNGREYTGTTVVDANGVLSGQALTDWALIARPVPLDVAAPLGQVAGEARLGTW